MIDPAFEERLRAVARTVAAAGRLQTEALVDSVLRAGGTSEPALLALLSDRTLDPGLRGDVCWLLPRLGIAADDALTAALSDASAQVRAEAAAALGLSADHGVVEVLLTALQCDSSTAVRQAAVHALGVHSASRSADGLVALMLDGSDATELRADAAEALAHVPHDRVVPALIAALEDPSPSVRFSAAYALGEQGDPTAREALQRLAATDHAETSWGTVASQAARSLEGLADRE